MKKWQQQQTRTELCELTDWRQTAFQAWNLSHACIHYYKASSTVRTALVCSVLRSSGGGAALAGAVKRTWGTSPLLCLCGVCYTDDDVVVCSQSGLNSKNTPNSIQKFVKLTGYTYDYLTNFEYEAHPMTGKGYRVNLLHFGWKNLWNHIKGTYFGRVLAI